MIRQVQLQYYLSASLTICWIIMLAVVFMAASGGMACFQADIIFSAIFLHPVQCVVLSRHIFKNSNTVLGLIKR